QCLMFSQVDRPHPALPSFPTRRSSDLRSIELEPEKFESYLKDEGLERVVKIRSDRKETLKPGREVFSRCAKTLLKVGAGAADGQDRKSTRLNSSHVSISYAVFCLKKKT